MAAHGWPRAARAARHHISSRLNALVQLPVALRHRQRDGVATLARHAFGGRTSRVVSALGGNAQGWLLTGGAGYIGAHVAHALRRSGRRVVVLDDLSTGLARRLPADVELVRAWVGDGDAVVDALRRFRIDGVIHLAGKKAVAESFAQPDLYYRENVVGLGRLLAAMQAADARMVFSSSAAVYGAADGPSVAEDAPTVRSAPTAGPSWPARPDPVHRPAHRAQLAVAALFQRGRRGRAGAR